MPGCAGHFFTSSDLHSLINRPGAKPGRLPLSFQFHLGVNEQQTAVMAVPGGVVVDIPVPHAADKTNTSGNIRRLFGIRNLQFIQFRWSLSPGKPVQKGALGFACDASTHFVAAIGANKGFKPFFHIVSPFSFILSSQKLPIKKIILIISHKNCFSLL
jgi:hypothetical protein